MRQKPYGIAYTNPNKSTNTLQMNARRFCFMLENVFSPRFRFTDLTDKSYANLLKQPPKSVRQTISNWECLSKTFTGVHLICRSLLRRTLATLFHIEPVLLKIAVDLLGIGTSANTFQLAPPDKSDERKKSNGRFVKVYPSCGCLDRKLKNKRTKKFTWIITSLAIFTHIYTKKVVHN